MSLLCLYLVCVVIVAWGLRKDSGVNKYIAIVLAPITLSLVVIQLLG